MRHLRAPRAAASGLVSVLVLAAPAAAQQFQHQPGLLPGPARWSEGVECADVDNDGDLDVIVADGEGFASAGTPRQNVLIVNQLVEQGPGIFTDESVARLGAQTSHGKGVATGDVDGDGWVDLLILSAFNTSAPLLYMNRGAAQPGFFDLESAARGFTTVLSAADAILADLDDDGDLDVIVCDSGPSYLGGPGGRPRLYVNDGTGHFAEDAAALAAPIKVAHMDAQVADVDGDWDLDYFGANRANNAGGIHYLLLNDGAAHFTNASSILPTPSTLTYEAELGDLDGDSDVDFFFLSLAGQSDGHVRNDLVPSGTLAFTAGATQPGSQDDNEIGLIDHDNDGDLDVFVGSLQTAERLYENQGNLVFVQDASAITSVFDSTLDLAIADLDNDGDYDVITVQGESNSAQWGNKVYLNTGAPDTLPPVIVATDVPAAPETWPVVLHARVRDQVIDDGVSYVTGHAAYAPVADAPAQVTLQGGAFAPAVLVVPVGTRVTFTNQDPGAETATSTTAPYAWDLPLPGGGGTAERVFVSPGTYDYGSRTSSATGQVVVTGTAGQVAGTHSGGGIHRFAVPELPQAASRELAVELFLRDWPGNVSASDSTVVPYPICAPLVYCTGKTNSLGCVPFLSTSGTASVAGGAFTVRAHDVLPGEAGFLLYGYAKANLSFHGGKLCVKAPLARLLPPKIASATGSPPCTGVLSRNFNTAIAAGTDPMLTAGQTVRAQWRQRDPADPAGFGDGLSDAVQFVICD